MYSYAGPLMFEPSAFLAIGIATACVRVVPKLESDTPSGSQPLQTSVKPFDIRKELANTLEFVMFTAGSFALSVGESRVTRPNASHVLPPRLGGSYITLP